MLYITDIKLGDYHESAYSLYVNKSTSRISHSRGQYALPTFVVFDNEDLSFEEIDSQYLVYCYCILGIDFDNIQKINNRSIFGKDDASFELCIKVSSPKLYNKIHRISHQEIAKSNRRLNEEFFKSKGVSYNISMRNIIVGSDGDGFCAKFNAVSGMVFGEKRYDYYLADYAKEIDGIYIGNTVLVDTLKGNEVTCFFIPLVSYEVLGRYVSSIFDLYELTVNSLNLAVGCNINDDIFTINTLTDRYVYRIDRDLISLTMKCKLLGTTVFGYKRI